MAGTGDSTTLQVVADMMLGSPSHVATWLISALSILAVIVRPWRLPEALWAGLGAFALVLFSLLPVSDAVSALRKGSDVYFFLIGMMVLAELARQEGLFNWLASHAVRHANGSCARLFALIYGVGTLVTAFLSNDATAVVLTPAVYAATKKAGVRPLPYLFICAFIANAASFVLPISNPANLVVFAGHMPRLWIWLREFAMPAIVSIAVTYITLRFFLRSEFTETVVLDRTEPVLSTGGRLAAAGIVMTGIVLITASSLAWQLGLPTFIAGVGTGVMVLVPRRTPPWSVLKDISWGVVPLVAGLFVLVQGVELTGVLSPLERLISTRAHAAPVLTALSAGSAAAILCNVINNLPLGLISATVATGAQLLPALTGQLLIA